MADWTPYKITTPAADASAGIALAAQAAKIGGILKADGQGNVSTATPGTDYGYSMIKGNGAPGSTTVGEIGQHYFDMAATQMPYEYVCVGYTVSGCVWKVYGEAGTGFELKGRFTTLDALKEAIESGLVDEPKYGDAYLIGDTQPYDCYYYSKTAKDWENIGPLGGEGGTGGDLPKGGATGQALVKNSAVDYDTAWGTLLVDNTQIADNAVTENKILDSSVTESKITDGAITTGKIADSAVTTVKIADGAITREKISTLLYNNAGAHNSLFRGKNLGTSFTSAHASRISSGEFYDMYIGDYWVIGGVTWRIAAFDYYYRRGLSRHHAVIVPDSSLYEYQMATSFTSYVKSKMYTEGLTQATATIKAAFSNEYYPDGECVRSRDVMLCNAVSSSGYGQTGWTKKSVDVILMTQQNVFGSKCKETGIAYGVNDDDNAEVDTAQYPLFRLAPEFIAGAGTSAYTNDYWLRDGLHKDSNSNNHYALVNSNGWLTTGSCDNEYGVRPAFCVGEP
jgi:hypothetical protein